MIDKLHQLLSAAASLSTFEQTFIGVLLALVAFEIIKMTLMSSYRFFLNCCVIVIFHAINFAEWLKKSYSRSNAG